MFKYSEKYYFSTVKAMTNCGESCCKVDAVVSIDSKGQIVLPKDIRERAKLKPNDKLAVMAYEKEGEVCCIMMIKAERLGEAVSKVLGHMLKDVVK
jgi:AbrB family looped-hinge helix DNA binding protein